MDIEGYELDLYFGPRSWGIIRDTGSDEDGKKILENHYEEGSPEDLRLELESSLLTKTQMNL